MERKESSDELSRLVSIIVPTRNSARTIEKCLQSISNQTYKNVETLVIDSYSSDNTHDIISEFNVRLFSLEGERTKAKNLGISNSKGEFILFLDSDMVLEPTVIEECVKVCSNDKTIAGIVIPERSIGTGFWIKVRDFERSLYRGTIIESARFFVKKFVILVDGFDEEIIAYEEATLPQKLHDKELNVSARISSFILHNEEGFDLINWLHKKHYYSASIKLYSQKYEKYAKIRFSVINRLRIFSSNGKWKVLVKNPVLSGGMIILKTLEYLASVRR